MLSPITLKLIVDKVEQLLCCDELNRTEREHLSWAMAHLREAGRESEDGSGRSVVRLQDDLWEERRRVAAVGLTKAFDEVGEVWPPDLAKKGVAA